MKKVILLMVLAIIAGGVFAQEEAQGEPQAKPPIERTNFIKPTFGLGLGSLSGGGSSMNVTCASADVDFVINNGFTIGLQSFMLSVSSEALGIVPVGAGYTYTINDKWLVTGKAMFATFFTSGAFGLALSGTYWILDNLGATAMLDFYWPKDVSVFALRAGISMKF